MPDGGCVGDEEWVEGHITDRCPVMFIHEYIDLFEASDWAETGVLPFSGGWAEQPYWIMEGLRIVNNEKASYRAEQMK